MEGFRLIERGEHLRYFYQGKLKSPEKQSATESCGVHGVLLARRCQGR
jgi:hypothetical protein